MKLTRGNLIRILVLNEASDGYWRFDRIEQESRFVARQCGVEATSDEIVQGLSALIRGGLIKAVWLFPREPLREIDGIPSMVDFHRVYVTQTQQGERVNAEKALGAWPLDDDGHVLSELCVAPDYAIKSCNTFPATSVSRKSRPLYR